MLNVVYLLIVLSVTTVAASATPLRCSTGGGGGVPFSTLPDLEILDWKPVHVRGSVEELLYWQDESTLVYRNSWSEVWEKNLSNQWHFQRLFNFLVPLSPVMDPSSRYFAGETVSSQTYVYDRKKSALLNLTVPIPNRKRRQLFWHGRSLYFVEPQEKLGRRHLVFFESNLRFGKSGAVCSAPYPDGVTEMHLVEGARYPHVAFYSESPVDTHKWTIALHAVDIQDCNISSLSTNGPILEVRPSAVHSFLRHNSYAVIVENTDQRLVWWNENGCKRMRTGDERLVVPNHSQPRLIGWSPAGISVLEPEQETRQRVGLGLKPSELTVRRSWISDDGKKLVLAPRLAGEIHRSLYEITVKRPDDEP